MSYFSPWLTPLIYWLGYYLILPLYFWGRIEVLGQENLPETGAVILAPTHRSRWDPILVGLVAGRCSTGRDLHFMVVDEEIQGIQGWFVRRLGGFAVNRDRPSVASFRHSVEILQKGEVLVIFPEGKIILEHSMGVINPGVARIALQVLAEKSSDLKIIPIAIHYGKLAPITCGTKVKINIGKPMPVNDYVSQSAKQSAKQLTGALAEQLNLLYS